MPDPTETMRAKLESGDRVGIVDSTHPWATRAGTLIAREKYGLGWIGWRIKLDGNDGECYANSHQIVKL